MACIGHVKASSMESLRARVIDIETRRSDAMTASRCDTDRRMNLDDVLWPGALSTGAMAAMAAGGVSVGSHVGDAPAMPAAVTAAVTFPVTAGARHAV